MTSQRRMEELKQRAKELAEQIDQLEEQINNVLPITGLLGLWATNRYGKQVLITTDRPVGGWIETAYVKPDGATREKAEEFAHLTFPEQTTRPEDVPVGEAWLVNAQDSTHTRHGAAALKIGEDLWVSGDHLEWTDEEVELITPLIPARPQDTPETVTTEEEYGALPEGSVVAKNEERAWTLMGGKWHTGTFNAASHLGMEGTTRHVLRRGWGE